MPDETHVYLAAALHFTQLPAMAMVQRRLNLRSSLQTLDPLARRLVLAITLGLVLYVLGTGLLAAIFPTTLLRSSLGNGLCALQAIAWSVRAGQQFTGIRAAWPGTHRRTYLGVSGVYVALAGLYSWFWVAGVR